MNDRQPAPRSGAAPPYAGWLWLVPAAAGAIATALIMIVLPPDRTLHGLGDFAFKVSPLVFAVLTIATFPRRRVVNLVLPILGFGFYLGVLDSAFFIEVAHLVEAAVAERGAAQFHSYYRFSIFVNAFTVLLALFAFRMGGAGTAQVLKLGFAGVLLLISGLNDLTMWAMYPWPGGQRPEVFSWASHVAIFLGHEPRLTEMVVFLVVHLAGVGVILSLPVQRWIDRLDQTDRSRGSRGPAAPPAAPAA